jgi:SAM-dependent methyltransferase
MSQQTKTHKEVSAFYAAAARAPGTGCCGDGVTQKGVIVKQAGYGADELGALPDDAVENSFGCGNPLAFAGVKEGDTVLDLGSGAGIDLLIAAPRVGSAGRVIGIDMTDEMIARARKNIDAAGAANVEVRKGLIEDLPVESASVDWVVSNCVINLSPDKPKVFAEIARVLKPGGRMSVSDIVVESMPEELRRSKALYGACVAGAISEKDYIAGLRAAGLEDVEVTARLVYDASTLAGLIGSEVPQAEAAIAAERGPDGLAQVARVLDGKVWSAKFTAQMPAD